MSKKFYAENRLTGERWKPELDHWGKPKKQFLVMYDSGYLAVVTQEFYDYIRPLDPKIWKIVHKVFQSK